MFGNHGLGGLPEEGAHEKSPKCLGGNLGDFGEFCKGLGLIVLVLMGWITVAVSKWAWSGMAYLFHAVAGWF